MLNHRATAAFGQVQDVSSDVIFAQRAYAALWYA